MHRKQRAGGFLRGSGFPWNVPQHRDGFRPVCTDVENAGRVLSCADPGDMVSVPLRDALCVPPGPLDRLVSMLGFPRIGPRHLLRPCASILHHPSILLLHCTWLCGSSPLFTPRAPEYGRPSFSFGSDSLSIGGRPPIERGIDSGLNRECLPSGVRTWEAAWNKGAVGSFRLVDASHVVPRPRRGPGREARHRHRHRLALRLPIA